jgi:biopolymer transport protein TolR
MSMDFGGKGVKSDINVTPLVDVVLVLLIIFMVITPLLQRGKAVQLPRAKVVSELKHGGDPILLSVTPDGRTWLDKVEVPRKDLAETLTGEMVARPGAALVVKADKTLAYRVVREVILEISKTRVVGVSLAATQVRPGEAR